MSNLPAPTTSDVPVIACPPQLGGWVCTVYPWGGRDDLFKIIAVRGEGRERIAMHVEKLTANEVGRFDAIAYRQGLWRR